MVKNQHYVPRFYLRKFQNEQDKFWVFHKDSGKAFLSNPQSIANENFFYDLPELDEALGEQAVEKYLAEIDGIHASFFDQLLKGIDKREIVKIDAAMRDVLCDFITIQIIRTKEHREGMSQGIAQFNTKLIESGWLGQEYATLLNATHNDEAIKKKHVEQLFFDTDFKMSLIGILNSHIWLIFKNMTDTPYYTSDHPVVKRPHIVEPHRSNTGYKSKGIEIAVPLSSTHLLVLVERTHFKHYEEYENEVLIHSEPQNVIYYNALQVSGAYRAIICREELFDLAREMVSTHPELSQLDTPRFGVD
jgi:hypothetical protein